MSIKKRKTFTMLNGCSAKSYRYGVAVFERMDMDFAQFWFQGVYPYFLKQLDFLRAQSLLIIMLMGKHFQWLTCVLYLSMYVEHA